MIRKIFVNDPAEVDFQNFGVHFSADNGYRHSGGGSNGTTPNARYEVKAFVETAEANEEATAVSNENHPHEKEVVLQANQEVKAKVFIIDRETGYYIGEGRHNGQEMTINTGTRCDKWAEKYF